jgi:hypothetical protein
MARSTKAEIERRLAEVGPLVCDCMTLREVRAWVDAKTSWGPAVSDSTLKYYMKRARDQMRSEAAACDRILERGVAKRRLERIIARSAAKGDLRTELAAHRQLSELLDLAVAKRGPQGDVDIVVARQQLELEIAQDLANNDARAKAGNETES